MALAGKATVTLASVKGVGATLAVAVLFSVLLSGTLLVPMTAVTVAPVAPTKTG